MKPSDENPDPPRDELEAENSRVDALDYADAVRGIAAGIADVDSGRTTPATVALEATRKRHRFPRSK
jgi:hypothetical protein